jgi:hypothetical protein
MVGIVTGNGLGLFNTSQDLLGLAIGQTSLGQAGGKAYVNAATGNLSVQFVDESLSGTGADCWPCVPTTPRVRLTMVMPMVGVGKVNAR